MPNILLFDTVFDASTCALALINQGLVSTYKIVKDEKTKKYQIDCNILKHVREDGTIQ